MNRKRCIVKQGKGTSDEDRFRALVESYGADAGRWPAEERRRRESPEARSAQAEGWLDEARRLDASLDAVADVVPSPALLRGVAEIPLRHGPSRAWGWWPFGRARNLLAAAVAVAAMGMVIGVTAPEPTATEDTEAGLDELSTLALGVDVSEELLP
jgi:hypothetical protein